MFLLFYFITIMSSIIELKILITIKLLKTERHQLFFIQVQDTKAISVYDKNILQKNSFIVFTKPSDAVRLFR